MKEDKQLIKRVKQGSEAALEQLVNKYYEQIFHYCYRLLGSYEEASNATQDIFISMMKDLSTYQDRQKFKSRLFTIAYNRCMNSFHGLKRSHSEMTVQQSNQGDEDFSERYVERKFVEDLLNTLPDIQKNALLLKYSHGLTANEIAHITGVNTATVKSRLYQELRKLQKKSLRTVSEMRNDFKMDEQMKKILGSYRVSSPLPKDQEQTLTILKGYLPRKKKIRYCGRLNIYWASHSKNYWSQANCIILL